MQQNDNSVRHLRGIIRDLVALSTTPAAWVGRTPAHIAESFADIVLHTLRAQAVYVFLESLQTIELLRGSTRSGLVEEIARLRTESQPAALLVETVTRPEWSDPLRIAIQPVGLSGDQGFVAVACVDSTFPNEAESLLLSVAANQFAVALQTARLRAETELERHRLMDLLTQAPAAIGLTTGPEHRWTYVNDHYVHITGRNSPADFVGKTVRESLPEINAQPYIGLLDDVFRTGKPYVGRETKAYLNRAHTGQSAEAYFDFVYQPVRTADGAVEGVLIHAVEVSDKVIARRELELKQQALAESEERFRFVFEQTSCGIAEVDLSGHFVLVNDQYCAIVRRSRDQLLRLNMRDITHPDDMAANMKDFAALAGGGPNFIVEKRYIRPDGSLVWVRNHVFGIRNASGQVQYITAVSIDITEQKRAERALRESEQRFRSLSACSPVGIFLTDTAGRCTYTNARCQEICGFTFDEALGEGWADFVATQDRATVLQDWTSIASRGGEYSQDFRWGKHPARQRWAHVRSSPLRSDDGKLIGHVGTVEDITDRKQAEEALRRSEEEFRALANSIPQLVWMANPDGWIFWYNQRWYEYTGTTPQEMQGWGWQSVHDPAVLGSVLERWKFSIATGQPFEMRFPLRGRDGAFRPFLTRVIPVRDRDGKLTRWFGTNTDVSVEVEAQHRLEAALAASQRLAALVESSDDAIIGEDLNGIVTSWNPAAERMFGFTADEMIGRSIETIIPPERQGEEPKILAPVARGDRVEHMETVRLTKSGRRIDVLLTISPVRHEDGTIVAAAKILRDVTEQKKVAETLQRSEKIAAVGRLAATMAHEINNPLESVTNLLFLARKDQNMGQRTRDYLQLADQELDRVAHVARQTLGFYRDNSAPSLFKVSPVIAELIDVYSYRFCNRDVQVEKELDDAVELFAPIGEFRQVFSNLFVNAIDALPSNGGRIRLRVQPGHEWNATGRSGVRITLADTGCGIPPESLPRIFDSFYTTKRDIGTGLGLWLTRTIVQKHGGRILVRSRVQSGQSGTVFSVFWPAEIARDKCALGNTA